MKKIILLLIVLMSINTVNAQKKKTKGKSKNSNISKIVDGVDFFDSPEDYVGKRVSLVVYYSTRNKMDINSQEEIDEDGQKYFDYSCRCLKAKDPNRRISKKSVNWKGFADASLGQEFTVNIPQSFFDKKIIKNGFKNGYLLISIDVYKGEMRGGGEKGDYSENPEIINYELVSIKRYK